MRPIAAWQGQTAKAIDTVGGGLSSGSTSRSSSGSGSDGSEVVTMRGYSLYKVAEEVAVANSGKEVVFTGKNVAAAVVYEQETETRCCSYADTDTCGGCFLRAFFRFLLLNDEN